MKNLMMVMAVLIFGALGTCQTSTHSVKLDWSASATPGVTYDVFRGNAPGAESGTPIASSLTTLTYLDNAAPDTACYTVKASLLNGATRVYSAPSNEACLTFPAAPGTLTATPQ